MTTWALCMTQHLMRVTNDDTAAAWPLSQPCWSLRAYPLALLLGSDSERGRNVARMLGLTC